MYIMKNHFFIGYAGNKRQEVKKIYDYIDLQSKPEIKIIVEPYCGTASLSYYIWLNNKDKNYKYVLNDNNSFLTELLEIAKDDNKLLEIYEKLKVLFNSVFDLDISEQKKAYDKIKMDENIITWIFKNKIYNIRPGLFPSGKIMKIKTLETFIKAPIIEFLKNADITISNIDGLEVYKIYCDIPGTFIFLDPPYLSRENSFYKSPTAEIYEYLSNNNIMKNKAYISLCLENSWIIKMLFKDFDNLSYEKYYETSKQNTTHIVIKNT